METLHETGESLTVISKDFHIHYIRPCTMEKGKKMAKIRLTNPQDFLEKLQKSGKFDTAEIFPDLGLTRLRLGRKHLIAFASGEVSIRAAEDEQDVLATARILADILRG